MRRLGPDGSVAGKLGVHAHRASAAQWLCGILCLIVAVPVACFGMLYGVAAGYAGDNRPLIWTIVLSILAYPVLAIIVVAIAALGFRRTRRFTGRTYLVPVAYLAAIVALLHCASQAQA